MASVNAGKNVGSLLLGICFPSLKHNASKFKVHYLYFDEKLLMGFKHFFYVYAYDPEKISKAGDVVLIKELEKKKYLSITHEVLEVIYPCGDITDPISGKKVVGSKFRDELELERSLYGETASGFVYKKAPKRGWQEDRKDFTHRPSYPKYHEFEKGDEYENQPYSTSY